MKIFLLTLFAHLLWLVVPAQGGTVVENWPAGFPNTCNSPDDSFDFEAGVDAIEIESTNPGYQFSNTNGLDWQYGDVRTANYNVNEYGTGAYTTNGNFFAWLGEKGDVGRIDFAGSTATYFSCLVSTSSLTLTAYDDSDGVVDSATATDNRGTDKMTQLTVSGAAISYVTVSDTGNFWLIDDICTDATSPCIPLAGRDRGPSSRRLDVVFLKDDNYTGNDVDFENIVNDMIDDRLLGIAPVTGNDGRFNFYISQTLRGTSTNISACGENILPNNFRELCPFADTVAVLHSETYGDCCSWTNVFSSEANLVRSFIHEAGHGVFGLADEYNNCNTSYFSGSNIYDTEADCLADAAANDPGANWTCVQFTNCQTGFWKVKDGQDTIMDDGRDWRNGYSPSSEWHLSDWFADVSAGGIGGAIGSESDSPDKSAIVVFDYNDGGFTFKKKSIRLAAPPQDYLRKVGPQDILVTIKDSSGAVLREYYRPDPRKIIGEPDYEGPSSVDASDISFVTPYFSDMASISLDDGTNTPLDVDMTPFAGQPTTPDPPTALCTDVSKNTDPGQCSAVVGINEIDDGSFDPQDRTIDLAVIPASPYPVGDTDTTLEVTNSDEWTDSCDAVVTVTDNEAPAIECNAPAEITPPQGGNGICFTATADDNCGVAPPTVTSHRCWRINPAGKVIDTTDDCLVTYDGPQVCLENTVGVGNNIAWTVEATDDSGVFTEVECVVVVVRPGRRNLRHLME